MARNQRRNRRNKSGSSSNQAANRASRVEEVDRSTEVVRHRSSTETKSSLKTTELIAYAGAVLAVVMTALSLDEDGRGGGDPFGAEHALRYITYLTIGYLVARGLAKSGSHENRVEHDTDSDDDAPARAVVVHDEADRDDDDDDLPDDVDETPEPAVEPADEVEHAVASNTDARP